MDSFLLGSLSYTGQRPVSNMSIVDIKMLPGFVPVKTSVRKVTSLLVCTACSREASRTAPSGPSVLPPKQPVRGLCKSFTSRTCKGQLPPHV